MVPRDAAKLRHVADAKDARLEQVLERAVVVLQAELAQAEKCVAGAVLRRERDHLPERVAASRIVVERVVRRAVIPVAFDVAGLELDRFGVEVDGLRPSFGQACLGGGFHDLVEFGGGSLAWRPRGRGRLLSLGPGGGAVPVDCARPGDAVTSETPSKTASKTVCSAQDLVIETLLPASNRAASPAPRRSAGR